MRAKEGNFCAFKGRSLRIFERCKIAGWGTGANPARTSISGGHQSVPRYLPQTPHIYCSNPFDQFA